MGYKTETFTIANGTTTSNKVFIEPYKVFALKMPSAFTGTALTFQGAETQNDTFVDVYDESGSQISLTVSTSRIIGLDAAALEIAAIPWIRVVSGSSEDAAREIKLMMKD